MCRSRGGMVVQAVFDSSSGTNTTP
uniref:Uncharacterized protein n=1 Tax=Anguilla anguilla TaxID=7936 RepID=A0A0E9TAG9_ANGAN